MSAGRPTIESLPAEPLARLLAVMAWLRDRRHGCPWDIEQTFRTIAPYTIEEAYEVADAIARDDLPALKEELGDLLSRRLSLRCTDPYVVAPVDRSVRRAARADFENNHAKSGVECYLVDARPDGRKELVAADPEQVLL